jgi:hypothetical protein
MWAGTEPGVSEGDARHLGESLYFGRMFGATIDRVR